MKYIVLYIIVLIGQSIQKSQNYPQCIHKSNYESISNSTDNFNRNFIALTQFLTLSSTGSQLLVSSLSSDANSAVPSKQLYIPLISSSILTYIIIFSVVGCTILTIFILRVKVSYQQKLRMYIGKQTGTVVGPCTAVLCIIAIVMLCMVSVIMSGVTQQVSNIQCQARYYTQLILYGNNASHWAGLKGIESIIQQQIKYFNVVNSMPNQYMVATLAIQNRIDNIQSFPIQFYQTYKTAVLQSPNTSTAFSTILPDLFTNESSPLLSQLTTCHNNLAYMANLAMQIEQTCADVRSIALNASLSLKKKMVQISMMRQDIQSSGLIQTQMVFSPAASSSSSLNISTNSTNTQFAQQYKFTLLISKIYLAVGLQSIFSYFMLILLAYKFRHSMLTKMTNLFWFILVLQFMLSLVFIYQITPISNSFSIQCPIYENLMTNSTYYYQVVGNLGNNNPGLKNYYVLYGACLFNNTQQNESQQQYIQFGSFSSIQQDTSSLTKFLTLLQTYISSSNPSNMNPNYIDLYSYSTVTYPRIKTYINNQITNKVQNWPYLNTLIDNLNYYTLSNGDSSYCYRHRWAGSLQMCNKGEDAYILPTYQHLNVNGSQGYNSVPTIKCLTLSSTDITGNLIFITYANMSTNYISDISNPACTSTANAILNISLAITDSLLQKYSRLSGIIQTIDNFRSSTDQFLRILRANLITKYDQYIYILRQSNTLALNPQLYSDYNWTINKFDNCSAIKQQMQHLYTQTCINMRANLMKIFLGVTIVIVCLAAIIVIGAVYGVNQEIKEIQYLYQGSTISGGSQRQLSIQAKSQNNSNIHYNSNNNEGDKNKNKRV